MFSIPSLSLISFWDSCNGNNDMLDIIPNILYSIIIFLDFLLFFSILTELFPLVYLPDNLCNHLYYLVHFTFLQLCFLFQLLHFSVLAGLFFFTLSCSSLKFSLCSSIISPNSVSILTNNALTSLPSKTLTSISLVVLWRVFLLFFNWDTFFCLLMLSFLSYEIRWNSSLW